MRTVPSTLRAALTTAALLALTSPALAAGPAAPAGDAEPGAVKVTPGKATPGSEVKLRAAGCLGDTGAAKSEAFVADAALTGGDGKGFPLTGEAMIRSTVNPGTYDISVTCDGEDGRAKGSLTVVEGKPQPKPKPKPSAASPTAPIRAGGGGSAAQLAARDEGPGKRHAVIGALLVSGAGLAVAASRMLRRRRRPE